MRQPTAPTALRAALPAALAAALVLVLSGCDAAPAPAPAPAGATAPAASPAPRGGPPTGPAGRSLWALIDDRGDTIRSLPDDDPDVTAVRRTVALHSAATDNRDHRTLTDGTGGAGSADSEFAFYSPEFTRQLKAQGYGRQLSALYRTNRLTTHQVKTAWYRSTLYKDRATAEAEMDTVMEFTAAAPGYLKKGGFALNTPYTQHRTVSLAKQGGKWKITAIRKSPLTKAAPRPETS
ncbi:hypothetical protein ACFV6Z_07840 [Streptomyces sp. NPDC059818]|uniref:hypothetical protein n=1 Tax=Streptomyces sp. NPDC059818 TaxID=3346962 RepID=UPI0036493BB6